MGAAWSYLLLRDDAFRKAAYVGLGVNGAFYALFKQSVAVMEDELGPALVADDEANAVIQEEEQLVLQHWAREADVLYDCAVGAFPLAMNVEEELEIAAVPLAVGTPRPAKPQHPPATREEGVLRGLCASPLSTCESIHQAIVQLERCLGGGDEFVRVLGLYPRARRLYSSQKKVAESDVWNPFRAAAMSSDYIQASSIVGSVAHGEASYPLKLKRLEEMSKTLSRGLSSCTLTLAEIAKSDSAEVEAFCAMRASMSFNQVMTDEAIALLETQRKLEVVLQVPHFVGSSLIETIQKLVALYPNHPGSLLLAAECAEQYQISPRQFWWVLLRVLAQNSQWRVLLFLARAQRPEVGYTPVVEVLLDADQDELAQTLIECIEASGERQQVIDLLASAQHHPTST